MKHSTFTACIALPAQKTHIASSEMAACEKTFGITELLERTLLHLPLKELLLAQRVSKTWRDLIQDSKKIRRALFLSTSDEMISYNYHSAYSGHPPPETPWSTVNGLNFPGKPILNPLIHHHTGYNQATHSVNIQHEGFINPVNPRCPGKMLGKSLRAMHNSSASWRAMTLLQPAASRLQSFCTEESGFQRNPIFAVRNRRGGCVTVGVLVNGLREHWLTCPNCPYMEEVENMWTYCGDEDTDVVKPDITGWEMLAEFAKRA